MGNFFMRFGLLKILWGNLYVDYAIATFVPTFGFIKKSLSFVFGIIYPQ
jgi:hypothetical protein